jgi:DNA-binding NtrC family response regulator
MDGKALYKKLLPIRPKMKVLYMSGYPEAVIAHHGILEEGIHFLHKPFSPAALTRKLREALGD